MYFLWVDSGFPLVNYNYIIRTKSRTYDLLIKYMFLSQTKLTPNNTITYPHTRRAQNACKC